jgi:hypothetical protein
MDASPAVGETPAMGRYHHDVYMSASTPRYLVLFDLQWKVIEYQRLEPCADLHRAMTTTLNQLVRDGWELGSTVKFGFVFLNRNGTRRLLILTERDLFDARPQTFSPFR